MPVNTPNPAYAALIGKWQRARDCREGSDAVKARGEAYLPKLGSHAKNPAEYDAYRMRALYYNATGRTVEGLTGLVFQKPPTVDIPSRLEAHLKDITLSGVPFEIFALKVLDENITTGRCFILLHLAGTTPAKQRPFWSLYTAEQVIDWRVERTDGEEVLTHVRLLECVQEPDPKDPWATKEIEQVRALTLRDGKYTIELWRKKEDGTKGEEWVPYTPPGQTDHAAVPLRRNEALAFIPGVFVGPTSISAEPERPPIDDLAIVNISHYQTMASLEHGRFWTALPTPWVSGSIDKETGPLVIGSNYAWMLGENGEAGMLEYTGQGLAALDKADEQKRHMMATLGARLLEDQPKGAETLGAVAMRHTGQHATLRTIVGATEQALTRALQIHVFWMPGESAARPEDVKAGVELNKEFFSVRATPEDVKAALLLWQSDAITFETLYERLQTGGWTREGVDAKQEKAEIERAVEERPQPEPMPLPGGPQPPRKPGAPPPPKPEQQGDGGGE
jgi:hypothetical protein